MDFNTTIDIILKDLRDVREIIDDLKNYPGIPRLQVELAKSKCKSAEEVIALLKSSDPGSQKPSAPEPAKESPLTAQSGVLIEIQDETPQEESMVQSPVIAHDAKAETGIIADKFSGKPNTLSDKFGSNKKEDDISSVLKTKHVDNLSDAIGINDKFLFIREIFAGSQKAYEEAVSRLNSAESYPDARAIIMSYSAEGKENEVVNQLLEIVKRKLPSDG
jgi:hypothetical protein